jgi:ADP-heptose:LPS heptosyltransferase
VIATGSRANGDGSTVLPRYFVARGWGRAYLRGLDALLLFAPRRSAPQTADPRRVLIAVGGQLGDAVLATGVLSFLEAAIPGVDLGVVSGSSASVVFQGQPSIRWIHTVDHWKQRRAASMVRRGADHWRSWRRAVREITAVGYDAAIDLCPFYPNMATVLWGARIPRRIGYGSGGGARLFTDTVPSPELDRHVVEHHAKLASCLVDANHAVDVVTPRIPPAPLELQRTVHQRLRDHGILGGYVVVHMGAGSRPKEWLLVRWRRLTADIRATDCAVVLTGRGERERAMADAVAANEPGVINLVDQLEWRELVEVIRYADGVVSPDTAVAHIAAAVGTSNVVIWAGINDPRNWRPRGDRTSIVMQPVPCAPCFLPDGCSHMTCVRGVAPSDVRAAMTSLGIADQIHRHQPAS